MHMREKLINWTFKHVHAFSISNLNTLFILLDEEKVYLCYLCTPPISVEIEMTYTYLHV